MINDIIEVTILSLNINFEGIGFFNNKKVCIKNVLPGEVVRAKILQEKQNFIMAKLMQILIKNPLRIEPNCKYYNLCGGCHLQVVEPKEALKLKADVIKQFFSNIFSGKILINESKNNFYYRNKVVFAVKQNLIVGFKKEGTNEIVEVEKCIIADGLINKILTCIKDFLKRIKINFDIKYFAIRVFKKDFVLTIVTKDEIKNFENFDSLTKLLKEVGLVFF